MKVEKADERGMQALIRALPLPPTQPATERLRDEQDAGGDNQPSVQVVNDEAECVHMGQTLFLRKS
ncbi:MAG TPA: hypothetical protein VJ865_04725 [Gemmatimonadaceae bacterium]|nr:hypothetical protein [Gemmatimonadaceae bacterium]